MTLQCQDCDEPLDDDQDPDEDGLRCEACQVAYEGETDMVARAIRKAEGLDEDEED